MSVICKIHCFCMAMRSFNTVQCMVLKLLTAQVCVSYNGTHSSIGGGGADFSEKLRLNISQQAENQVTAEHLSSRRAGPPWQPTTNCNNAICNNEVSHECQQKVHYEKVHVYIFIHSMKGTSGRTDFYRADKI